jgi:hypothetical protein
VLTTLFDKSFLQSLSVDESVWFDEHFLPVICPVFYVETLADLAKQPTERGPAENEVRKIAAKFPEMRGYPCASHFTMAVGDLLGQTVPMDGRVPLAGGRYVQSGKRRGTVFDESPEVLAFIRWQRGEFLTLERLYASSFRCALANLDLREQRETLRAFGIDGKVVTSLEDAKAIASGIATGNDKCFERLRLAVTLFNVPQHLHEPILSRWHEAGCPSLPEFAPYTTYALTVELFFQMALAGDLISTERPSNRMDIAYLFYLPFCQVFISGDRLHRRCAPLFMRPDQEFVWAHHLKADLARLNAYYLALPEAQRERGLSSFAHLPPKTGDFLVARIYDRFGEHWRREREEVKLRDRETEKALVDELLAFTKSRETIPAPADSDDRSLNCHSLTRQVHKRKGNWWQLPKDLRERSSDHA